MVEYALARSPIAPAAPETEIAGWAVSGRVSDAPLTIADRTPLAKVLLRTARDPGLGVRYGAAARQDWDGVGVLVVGWGPDEWQALGPPGAQRALVDHLSRTDGTVVDVTHRDAVVRVTGERAGDLLSRECALDLSDRAAPDGTVVRTAVSGVAAGVVRDDTASRLSYLVSCEWSLGRYLYESLLDAGKEWGVEVDGLRMTQSQ